MNTATTKFVTQAELGRILGITAGQSMREHLMILLAYRHGLRTSEICGLRVDDVDLGSRHILCRRGKGSTTNWQKLEADEVVGVGRWLAERSNSDSRYMFPNGRGGAISRQHFFRLFRQIAANAGVAPEKRHPHVLKHALATHLASAGVPVQVIQQRLGHRNIQNTMVYLAIASDFVDRTVASAIEAGNVV
ncbi:MAG: site-specific recombinase XerD [Candidatus Azotimanducaceae bacterium]|jgi:site-specific recombinase XerD